MPEPEDPQLTPFKTPYSNALLRGPEGSDVGDLDVELRPDERGQAVSASAWELTERQREWIAAGAHIRLSVWQHPIPPLAVAVESPFCPECGLEMVYGRAQREFRCINPQHDEA